MLGSKSVANYGAFLLGRFFRDYGARRRAEEGPGVVFTPRNPPGAAPLNNKKGYKHSLQLGRWAPSLLVLLGCLEGVLWHRI